MININKDWKFEKKFPPISAYTTTYNCILGKYPFEKAIESFSWCDEIVVVDGGSTDGTREKLADLCSKFPNLRVYDIPIDLDSPGKDGQLKTMSRTMTSGQYCIQFDSDEFFVGSSDWVKDFIQHFPRSYAIVDMLVVEPFGDINKIRTNREHNPLKWRLSRNRPEVVHSIPNFDRFEKDGKVYSKGASDGCFPVDIVSNAMFPSFVPTALQPVYEAKKKLDMDYSDENLQAYKSCFLNAMKTMPYILHVGHVDVETKIRNYLRSWHSWWCGLYGYDVDDPKNNAYFRGVKISDVTEQMILDKTKELKSGTKYFEIEQGIISI